jgi:hypothetical protein
MDTQDPEMKNLNALKIISGKLNEVSKALKGCQEVTGKLAQAVDIIAKRYPLYVESINEQLDIENETIGE